MKPVDLLRGVLDLVFAPICLACSGPIHSRASVRGVCVACWARMRPLPFPRCDRCWTPRRLTTPSVGLECSECPSLRPAVRGLRSAFLLHGPARAIVHALKYRGWHSVAHSMAERMAAVPMPAEAEEIRYVVPVPLAPVRRRQRGYNQAALLAAGIATARGWELREDVLRRTRSDGSQTTLHPGERRANVADVFRVHDDTSIDAEHLLLVDDVWTTGATALACADALLSAGARAVTVLTFARALPEIERLDRRLEAVAIS